MTSIGLLLIRLVGELGANGVSIRYSSQSLMGSVLSGFNLPSSESPKYIRSKGKRRGKDTYLLIAIMLIQ